MFQLYMVIIRLLAHKKENNFAVGCWSEILVLYASTCMQYIPITLVSNGEEDGKNLPFLYCKNFW